MKKSDIINLKQLTKISKGFIRFSPTANKLIVGCPTEA